MVASPPGASLIVTIRTEGDTEALHFLRMRECVLSGYFDKCNVNVHEHGSL